MLFPLLVLISCTGPGAARLRSVEHSMEVRPRFQIEAYTSPDRNTAHIYLTDIDRHRFLQGTDWHDLTGNIVHVHLFVSPHPGRTPIENSACSVTVRHLILTGGEAGVYSGGGFMLPDTKPGSGYFTGDLSNASMRLTRSTAKFIDRLGAARFDGTIGAPRDDATSRLIGSKLESILADLPSGAGTP